VPEVCLAARLPPTPDPRLAQHPSHAHTQPSTIIYHGGRQLSTTGPLSPPSHQIMFLQPPLSLNRRGRTHPTAEVVPCLILLCRPTAQAAQHSMPVQPSTAIRLCRLRIVLSNTILTVHLQCQRNFKHRCFGLRASCRLCRRCHPHVRETSNHREGVAI
jgi:hypothetical protein